MFFSYSSRFKVAEYATVPKLKPWKWGTTQSMTKLLWFFYVAPSELVTDISNNCRHGENLFNVFRILPVLRALNLKRNIVQNLNNLPRDLPVPFDDGACDHLLYRKLPSINLSTTDDSIVDFSSIKGRVVIYLYPMTGRPDTTLPDSWDEIPGARGCTPQSCSFRDHYSELRELQASVYGLSTQDNEYQKEAVNRLHLPFSLVSDSGLQFIQALNIPTMNVSGMTLSKRITLIANRGIIEKVFYPVFPPNENAYQVIKYLKANKLNEPL